jgi:hypothetical protein
MWEVAIAVTIWLTPPPESQYYSCPNGYLVKDLEDCPPVIIRRAPGNPPIGGGPGRRGLLGLGGIGGIL